MMMIVKIVLKVHQQCDLYSSSYKHCSLTNLAHKPQERPLRTKKSHRRLPDLSSPSLMPALPTGSTLQPTSALPTPNPLPLTSLTNPHASPAPNAHPSTPSGNTSNAIPSTETDIYYPPQHLFQSESHSSPLPPQDLFRQYFLSTIAHIDQRYASYNEEERLRTADTEWENIGSGIRASWNELYEHLSQGFEKGRAAAAEWKKTVENNRPGRVNSTSGPSGQNAVKGDDGDVVMKGVEEGDV
jgi:hypothetical protein